MSRTVLITGATGGLGKELARTFACHGHDLVLTARDEQKLKALASDLRRHYHIRTAIIPADLQQREAIDTLVGALKAQHLQVDILVNNAGFGDHGPFAFSDPEKQEAMIRVNVLSLTALTRAIVPSMIEQGYGRILNIASIASFSPGPLMSVYFATKAYVLSFSEAIAAELKPYGITVTALCPGLVNTGFEKAAALNDSRLFDSLPVSDPADVARYGYKLTMCGRRVGVHGAAYKALAFASHITPHRLSSRLLMLVQRDRHKL